MLARDGLQRPTAARAGESFARGCAALVVSWRAPHLTAPGALVAAHRHHPRRRAPPEGFVRQGTLAATAAAPLGRLHDQAGQDRTIGIEALLHQGKAELVQA